MSDEITAAFGIDLGTTYSVIAHIDETGRPAVIRNTKSESDTTPSVVYFENETNVVIGQPAKEAAPLDPDNVVSLIKREMGNAEYTRTFWGQEHTPPSISATILAALAHEAEAATGKPVKQVVITVPAYFGLLERDATRKAGEIADLEVIGIVPEPVAAALHYGVFGDGSPKTILVFDLGGGTFDISVMRTSEGRIEVLATDGNHRLGGADWDRRLREHITTQLLESLGDESLLDDESAMQDLVALTERIKRDLSSVETKTTPYRYGGRSARITVTRAEFEDVTSELLDECVRITERALDGVEAKYPGIRDEISDVLLVGGSARCRRCPPPCGSGLGGSRNSRIPTCPSPKARRCTRPARPSGSSRRSIRNSPRRMTRRRSCPGWACRRRRRLRQWRMRWGWRPSG